MRDMIHSVTRYYYFVLATPMACRWRLYVQDHDNVSIEMSFYYMVILYISTTIIHGFISWYVMFWSVSIISISDPNNLDMVLTPQQYRCIYTSIYVNIYIYISEYIHILYIYIHSILYIPCHENVVWKYRGKPTGESLAGWTATTLWWSWTCGGRSRGDFFPSKKREGSWGPPNNHFFLVFLDV